MKAIVSVDQNWGIGYRGELLQKIPEDMKFFRQMTVGKVVVMGRETFESLPGKEPLKDRINIVLSKSGSFHDDKIIICRTLEQLLQELEEYSADDIYIIGGETVYSQLLSHCTEAYVTKIQNTYPADKYFMNMDQSGKWMLVSQSEWKNYDKIQYCFVKYVSQSNTN